MDKLYSVVFEQNTNDNVTDPWSGVYNGFRSSVFNIFLPKLDFLPDRQESVRCSGSEVDQPFENGNICFKQCHNGKKKDELMRSDFPSNLSRSTPKGFVSLVPPQNNK